MAVSFPAMNQMPGMVSGPNTNLLTGGAPLQTVPAQPSGQTAAPQPGAPAPMPAAAPMPVQQFPMSTLPAQQGQYIPPPLPTNQLVTYDPMTGAPPTGLIGAENALLAQQVAAQEALAPGMAGIEPFLTTGQQAQQQQAALAGALGPEAQAAALAEMQPMTDFIAEQGRQEIMRNAAALGGLGGGQVQKELTSYGQQMATQNIQQAIDNLATLSASGLGAAGTGAQLATTGAGLEQALGQQLAAGRTGAGTAMAGAIGETTSALSQLSAGQGEAVAGEIGTGAGNISNLLSGTGQQYGANVLNMANLLSGIDRQQLASIMGEAGVPGVQQTGGILSPIGQLASGVGGFMTGYKAG